MDESNARAELKKKARESMGINGKWPYGKNLGTKRGNPEFVSSSFYVPKKINLMFDRAILTLKAHGFELDRSDVLSVLMDRFAISVDAAEQRGEEEMDLDYLDSILGEAGSGSVEETAGLTFLKSQIQKQGAEFDALVEEFDRKQLQKDDANKEMISLLMSLLPDDVREKMQEKLKTALAE